MTRDRGSGSNGQILSSTRVRIARLSEREREVVRLLRAGKPYKAIAGDLGIDQATVAEYIKRAYRKLGVSSRYDLPRV